MSQGWLAAKGPFRARDLDALVHGRRCTGAHAPTLSSPSLKVIRAGGTALTHGIETHDVDGLPVRLTTPAKTVPDCFRYRRHVGLELAFAAGLPEHVAQATKSRQTEIRSRCADRRRPRGSGVQRDAPPPRGPHVTKPLKNVGISVVLRAGDY